MNLSPLRSSEPLFIAYLAIFTAAALTCLAGAWRARQVESPDVRRGLIGLLGTSGLWAGAHVGMLLASGLLLKAWVYDVGLIVGFGTVGAWLWLCSAYSGRQLHRSRGVQWGALVIFAVVTLTKLTNPWHGLYFSARVLDVPFPHLSVDHHILYWGTAALSYAGAAVGFFMLYEPLRRARVGSGRLAGLFGLTALPLLANGLGYLSPSLLDVSHEPVGVAAFAVGVLFVYQDQFEETSRAGRREKPTLILSEEDRIRNYNDRAAALFPTLQSNGAVGQNVADLLPEVAEALAGEAEVLPLERRGAVRYYRPTEYTFGPGSGRQVALADVTERTLRRRVQAQEHRFLTTAVQQAREAVLVTTATPLSDPGPRIVYANEAFEEMTGYREAEVLGKTPRLLQGPETERDVLDSLRAALEAGDEWEGETINYRKDGTPYRVHWNIAPVRGAGGQIEHWISVQRDVTEQREREEALRRQKSLLDQAQRLAGAWEVDLQAGEMSWSEEVYRIHEVEPGTEMEMEESLTFCAPRARPKIREAFDRCIEEEEPYDLELPIVTAEGNRRWVRTVGAPAETEKGEVTKVAGAFQDITDRKEAERELRRSQERLQMATEAGNVGTWNWDLETDGVVFNDQWAEMLGYSREELDFQFSTWEALVHPEDLPRAKEALERYIEGDAGTYAPEIRMRTKSGDWKWIQTIGKVTERGEDGTVTRAAGVHLDIDERKRAEQALREQEERLRGIANSLPGVVFQTGPRTDGPRRIRFVGEAAEEILGLRADPDGFRERLLKRIPEPHRDELLRSLDEATEAEHPWRFEMPFDRPDGERIWILGTSTPTWKDGELVYNGVLLDITERKRAERALQQSRQRYRSLFRNSNNAILIHDLEGNVHEANPQAEALFGNGDLEGRSVFDLHAPAEEDTAREKLESLQAGDTYEAVARYERADGSTFWGEVSASAIEIGDESVARTLIRDVTEREENRQQLEHYRVYTDRLLDAIDDLFFVIGDGGTLQRWNNSVPQVTGYTGEEIESMEALDFVPESEQGRVANKITKGFMAGHAQVEVPLLRKDGTTVPYECVGNLVKHPDGGLRVVGVGRDISERKQRKQRLERQNDLFERAQAIADVGAWEYDVRTDTVTWTNEVYRIHDRAPNGGLTPEEALSHYHPDDQPRIREALDRAVQDGTPYDLQLRLITGEDEEKWIRTRGEPQAEGGEIVRVRGTIQDITERKDVERILQGRKQKIEALYDATRHLLAAEHPGAVSDRIHEVLRDVFDYPFLHITFLENGALIPGRTTARGGLHLPDPEPRSAGGDTVVDRALRAGEAVVVEHIDALDNEIEYGDLRSAVGIPIGERGAIVVGSTEEGRFDAFNVRLLEVLGGYASLVLGRLAREAALRESEQRFRKVFRNAAVGIAIVDGNGRLLETNAALQDMMGRSAAELEETHFSDLTHPDDLTEDKRHFAELMAGKRDQYQLEKRYVRGDGEVFWGRLTVSRFESTGDGQVVGLLEDIDAKKRYREKLRRAKEEAEEASRLKSVFLANMSHEIRTPLTSILGFAEAIGEETKALDDDEEPVDLATLRRFANLIEESGQRLMDTLTGVLNLSRLEAGDMDLSAEPVDLVDQAERVARELRPQAEEKGLDFQVEADASAVWAQADAGGVQIVARNLVSNALKYTEEGGAWVRAYQADGCAVLEVEDTGIGMDPDLAEDLFEPFRQESEGLGREYEGTGLGLAVTRRAVEAMGGTIEVEAEDGEGCCFTVQLPQASGVEED